MVLVEEGPWQHDSIEANLRRLQDRLYGCIDAALDGQLAAQFPESKGEAVVIRVDAYDLPDAEVRAFFNRFAAAVLELADMRWQKTGSWLESDSNSTWSA